MKEYQHQHTRKEKVSTAGFSFRFTEESEALELAGYAYNAITPFFMKYDLPIILSQDVAELEPAYFWMGGGTRNLKIGVSVADFLKFFGDRVIVAKI